MSRFVKATHFNGAKNIINQETQSVSSVNESFNDAFGKLFKNLKNNIKSQIKKKDEVIRLLKKDTKKVPANVIEIHNIHIVEKCLNLISSKLSKSYQIIILSRNNNSLDEANIILDDFEKFVNDVDNDRVIYLDQLIGFKSRDIDEVNYQIKIRNDKINSIEMMFKQVSSIADAINKEKTIYNTEILTKYCNLLYLLNVNTIQNFSDTLLADVQALNRYTNNFIDDYNEYD